MLNNNIRELRRERGMTQEELAIRLNVVRQTVSKWEKGFSVPDADMLQKLADTLEVSVSCLLGGEPEQEAVQGNEIAGQLSRINEQFAVRSRRGKVLWRVAGIVLCLWLLMMAVAMVFSFSGSVPAGQTASAEAEYHELTAPTE